MSVQSLLSSPMVTGRESAPEVSSSSTLPPSKSLRLAPLPNREGDQRCSRAVLARYADHPSAYLAMNQAAQHFTTAAVDGCIAYRAWGGYLYQFGNVFAAPDDQATLLAAFCAYAHQQRKQVCTVQLRRQDIGLYQQAGFRINQLGTSYTLDLQQFGLRGAKFANLRNKIHRAQKQGVRVVEVGVNEPFTPALQSQIDALSAAWLRSKGAGKKLLDFMVGELETTADSPQRVFLALQGAPENEQLLGFIRYAPSYGRLPGMLHDLTRRIPDAPPGVMELINSIAFERFKAEGIRYLHFGFTPCVGLSDAADDVPERSKALSWIIRKIHEHGAAIYPAQSQVEYKLKWGPQIIEPEYIAFQGSFRLGHAWSLLRLTRAI